MGIVTTFIIKNEFESEDLVYKYFTAWIKQK